MNDEDGVQIMHALGKIMVWLLKCKVVGLKAGIPLSELEERASTNFIR